MATKHEIQKAVMRLSQAFTAFKPDPEDMKGFMELVYEKLANFPTLVINEAVEQIIETENYFPRIAEMITACIRVLDKHTYRLSERHTSLKLDWHGDKIHPIETWQKLANEYKKIGWTNTAAAVMDDYKEYGKLCRRVTPEQIEQARQRISGVKENMEAK
jgi:hypothetical protein